MVSRSIGQRAPFAVAIFLGAFLLFQIQPLVGRILLPWFGGGTLVWTAVLMFFQVVLLGGYLYAHGLVRLSSARVQGGIHVGLLAVSLWWIPLDLSSSWIPQAAGAPSLHILGMLAATIGLPTLLVATTAPLVQTWFGRVFPGSPYRLYSISNTGALLALVSYPFVVAPRLDLYQQRVLWSITYGVFVSSFVACAWLGSRGKARPETTEDATAPWADRTLAFALSALGVVLLLATTSALTMNIAPVPFLWVMPLALYLSSYILCFSGWRVYRRRLWMSIFGISILPTLWLRTLAHGPGLWVTSAVLMTSLFAGCMLCHGELHRLRPRRQLLTGYYLLLAAGGVVGGLFVGLIAPRIFSDFWELEVGLWGTLFVVVGLVLRDVTSPSMRRASAILWAALGGLFIYLGAAPMQARQASVTHDRSSYGRLAVHDEEKEGRIVRTLTDGAIVHGSQVRTPRPLAEPTLYYQKGTGVGLSFEHYRGRGALRVGVIGLGTGTIASYSRKGDVFRFYELNPSVVSAAREHFTYLHDSAGEVQVEVGDARLSLERELREGRRQGFDILVVDAFSSDAIPMHLLTREAFTLYRQHLRPEGLLLLNVTNSYLELSSVARAVSASLGLQAIRFEYEEFGGVVWVGVTGSREYLEDPALSAARTSWPSSEDVRPWTDDYANVLGALR